jgi:hypothetical protein
MSKKMIEITVCDYCGKRIDERWTIVRARKYPDLDFCNRVCLTRYRNFKSGITVVENVIQ